MSDAARSEVGLTVQEVASLVGGRWEGDASTRIRDIKPVEEAGEADMALLVGKRYVRFVPEGRAGAYLVTSALARYVPQGVPRVIVDEPHVALAELLEHLHPPRVDRPQIHRTAVLGRGARIGKDVGIGAYAVIEDGVRIGDGCRIGAHCVVGRNTTMGPGCHLYPHVVVYEGAVIGARVVLHSGVRLGSDGFGYTFADGAHRKIPQVGRCIIEDDVEVGANTAVDRGSLGDTVVGSGAKIDNLVQIAHNVRIGALSMLAGLVGIAGSTRIGRGVWIGGQAGVINHLEIGDNARVAVAARVMRDVRTGETVSGDPARPHREHLHRQAQVGRIPRVIERVEHLEAEVERLSGGGTKSS